MSVRKKSNSPSSGIAASGITSTPFDALRVDGDEVPPEEKPDYDSEKYQKIREKEEKRAPKMMLGLLEPPAPPLPPRKTPSGGTAFWVPIERQTDRRRSIANPQRAPSETSISVDANENRRRSTGEVRGAARRAARGVVRGAARGNASSAAPKRSRTPSLSGETTEGVAGLAAPKRGRGGASAGRGGSGSVTRGTGRGGRGRGAIKAEE